MKGINKMTEIVYANDFSSEGLQVYRNLSETQLRHFFEPENGVFLAESPNVIERALEFGCRPLSFLAEEAKTALCIAWGEKYDLSCPIYSTSNENLREIVGFPLTRGVISAMYRPEPLNAKDVLDAYSRVAILESVVNPTNIGAIFRSAAALNMDAVLLTQNCCDPLSKRAVRVSMGTVFQIPWAYIAESQDEWVESGISMLHEKGYQTVAMALKPDSFNINDPRLKKEEKLAVILGTEGEGLCAETIEGCDYTVCIPMGHGVDSLNVAAASAVAFWELGHN